MKKLVMILWAGSLLANTAPLDVKKNQKLQKLSQDIRMAQVARDAFLKSWSRECEDEGKVLKGVDMNSVGCDVQLPQPPAPPKVETK